MNLNLNQAMEMEKIDGSIQGGSPIYLDDSYQPFFDFSAFSVSTNEINNSKARNEDSWVEEMYSLNQRNFIDEALDILFEKMDDLFCQGDFGKADNILKLIDLSRLELDLWIGVLSITASAREHLPYRMNLFSKISRKIEKDFPNRKHGLLDGLE